MVEVTEACSSAAGRPRSGSARTELVQATARARWQGEGLEVTAKPTTGQQRGTAARVRARRGAGRRSVGAVMRDPPAVAGKAPDS